MEAQHIRQYTYVHSAIEPKTGESVSLSSPSADTDWMTVFLQELSERYPEDESMLVLDGAGWHRSGGAVVPANTRFFGNAYFETLDAVEAHLVKALRWVESNTAWVKLFAYFPYIQHAI